MSKKHQAQKRLNCVQPQTLSAKRRAVKENESNPCRSVDEEYLTVETADKITGEFDLREEDAKELVRKHRPFLEDCNIVWLSVGPKEVRGMKTNRLALIFGVVKKKGTSELSNNSKRSTPREKTRWENNIDTY